MILECLFWILLSTLFYTYFGFLFIIVCRSFFYTIENKKSDLKPSVSLIVCAYNEEVNIIKKIDNCLDIDYPRDLLEIIIISDCSTDMTNIILQNIKNPLIKIFIMDKRSGKTSCQNYAVKQAKNDIIFFTDATTIHKPNILKQLVQYFHDEKIGCVSGQPVFNKTMTSISVGQNKRDKYELFLRYKLSQTLSLMGAQDCVYAMPRKLYIPIRDDLGGGFAEPLLLLEKGYRTIYEPNALAFIDRKTPSIKDEFNRRTRMILQGLRVLIFVRKLLNPFKYRFIAITLISSRLLRWLSPIILIMLFFINLLLINNSIYLLLLIFQITFYSFALLALFYEIKGVRTIFIFYIPFYFCLLMCSALFAIYKLFSGKTDQIWDTVR